MRLLTLLLLLLTAALPVEAQREDSVSVKADTACVRKDTACIKADTARVRKKNLFKRFLHNLNDFDTTYIEPSHYDWTVQLQSQNTIEKYVAKAPDGRKLTFSPGASWRMGPYGGWRFLVSGLTLDVGHLAFGSRKSNRSQFSLSIWLNMFNIDIYRLDSGDDFGISSLDFDSKQLSTGTLRDITAEGIDFNLRGLNITYIFNHRRYAYKSVYAQSTMQRRSAGSWLLGLGYTRHAMTVDWDKVDSNLQKRLGTSLKALGLDTMQTFTSMKFADLSLSVGYGYNWVLSRNWVFNTTLTLAFAYNQPRSYDSPSKHLLHFHDFSWKNINMYEMARFGVIWQRKRWYAGAHALLRNYNFKRDQLSIQHLFGSLNVYVAYYIGRYR